MYAKKYRPTVIVRGNTDIKNINNQLKASVILAVVVKKYE